MKKNIFYLFLLVISVSSCLPRLQGNGFFKADGEAETLISKKIDLDEHKSLLVVPGWSERFFTKIGYFDEVLGREKFELELQLQYEELKDFRLSEATAGIIYEDYRPFLELVLVEEVRLTNTPGSYLELVNPQTSEVLFRTRSSSFLDASALNEFLKYIQANSLSY